MYSWLMINKLVMSTCGTSVWCEFDGGQAYGASKDLLDGEFNFTFPSISYLRRNIYLKESSGEFSINLSINSSTAKYSFQFRTNHEHTQRLNIVC